MTTVNKFNRNLKDIPELVAQLRAEKARERDYLLPQSAVEAVIDENEKPALRLTTESGAQLVSVLDQSHGQIAGKCLIPKVYYDKMINGNVGDLELWTRNVNHWLAAEPKKKRLIRMIDNNVRAWLSSKYRPISHLDLVTTLVQTATDLHGFAAGAKCFAWTLNPSNLSVCFFNPRLGVNLTKLEEGFKTFGPEDLDEHGFYRDMKRFDAQNHWVFPTATCNNSETGQGGMGVARGLLEGYCLNGNIFKKEVSQVHIGRELTEDDLWSADTLRKLNAVIFAKVRDVTKETFEPQRFLNTCRKFKGLEAIELDVKVAADQVAQLDGLTEEVRDDILEAYYATTAKRNNLFDFNRAVTATAHAYRESKPEIASRLEELGGSIIEQGKGALVAA